MGMQARALPNEEVAYLHLHQEAYKGNGTPLVLKTGVRKGMLVRV